MLKNTLLSPIATSIYALIRGTTRPCNLLIFKHFTRSCLFYPPNLVTFGRICDQMIDKLEFTLLFHQTLRVLMKCPSCTDANVAKPATMATGTMDQKTVGTVRKRRRPVSLLAIV